ncbi:hypothetical protein D3C80_1606440 [compost metagenome]
MIAQTALGHGDAKQLDGFGFQTREMQIKAPHPATLHPKRGEGSIVDQGLMLQVFDRRPLAIDEESAHASAAVCAGNGSVAVTTFGR